MTLRGSASIELSFLLEGEDAGEMALVEAGVENHIRGTVRFAGVNGCALRKDERDAVWAALPEWLREKLMGQAADDAELVDDDDAASDAAREVA